MNMRRFVFIAALSLLIGGKCPKPTSTAGPKQAVTSGYEVELTSAASPDSPQCPGGRLTIASWGSLFNGPLDGSAAMTDVTQQLYDAFPPFPNQPWGWGGDEVLARMPNGDLLFGRQGTVGNNPDLAPPNVPTIVMRGIEWFWISSDCGQHWEAHSAIDSQQVFGGDCAVSRKNADGAFLQSGWDRGELAVNPWTGKAYFNTDCDSDAGEGKGFTTRLFTLEPGAKTWTPSPVILPRFAPAVMTVTQTGALWLFHCEGDKPMLYRSEDGGMSFPPPTNLAMELPANDRPMCGSVDNVPKDQEPTFGHGAKELAGHQEVLVYDYGLSRAGVESVRVTYPTLTNGRAQLVNLNVTHKGGGEFSVLQLVHRFTPDNADGSEIQPSFIERDDVAGKKSVNPTGVLYWLESSPSKNEVRVRYSVSTAGAKYDDAKTLGDPWTPNLDPNDPITKWAGDYQNGSFVCVDHKMNFILVWPESDPAISTPNEGIHYATVTVDEDC